MPQFIHLPHTGSTNQYLRDLVEATKTREEGTVIWADYQSAGKGQKGNTWESEEGKNLLFTLLLCPDCIEASDQFIISQMVSLAIIDVLSSYSEGFSVKWPNDIYYNDKKIAGILIENDIAGRSIFSSFIGIGINVNQTQFLSDAPNPVSLVQIIGEDTSCEMLLSKIIESIYYYYDIAIEGNFELIRKDYMSSLYRKDDFYDFSDADGFFSGKIKNVAPSGTLTITDQSGIDRNYEFKEVVFENI